MTTQTITIATEADVRRLSYYTLCKLSEATHYATPATALPLAIARGEFKGVLTVDSLGNFLSFV
jgi:hypothetical protein